jgi:hypothetical protein
MPFGKQFCIGFVLLRRFMQRLLELLTALSECMTIVLIFDVMTPYPL